jgi:hypothetical protein
MPGHVQKSCWLRVCLWSETRRRSVGLSGDEAEAPVPSSITEVERSWSTTIPFPRRYQPVFDRWVGGKILIDRRVSREVRSDTGEWGLFQQLDDGIAFLSVCGRNAGPFRCRRNNLGTLYRPQDSEMAKCQHNSS